MTYVRISSRGSWHLAHGVGLAVSWMLLCGRRAHPWAETSETLPEGEKSCETCLRVAERQRQREETA